MRVSSNLTATRGGSKGQGAGRKDAGVPKAGESRASGLWIVGPTWRD